MTGSICMHHHEDESHFKTHTHTLQDALRICELQGLHVTCQEG